MNIKTLRQIFLITIIFLVFVLSGCMTSSNSMYSQNNNAVEYPKSKVRFDSEFQLRVTDGRNGATSQPNTIISRPYLKFDNSFANMYENALKKELLANSATVSNSADKTLYVSINDITVKTRNAGLKIQSVPTASVFVQLVDNKTQETIYSESIIVEDPQKPKLMQYTPSLKPLIEQIIQISSKAVIRNPKMLFAFNEYQTNSYQVKNVSKDTKTEDSTQDQLPLVMPQTIEVADKTALIIGNGKYTNFPVLKEPVKEAEDLAHVLSSFGFEVFLYQNIGFEEMLDAILLFEKHLTETKGLAFFHYGGHGVQVSNTNYLIPVNADIPEESRLRTRAVNFQEVVASIENSGASASVLVLDACRDNPLPKSTRSASRGLSVAGNQPPNSIIIYAAEAGTTAKDGLFTPTLIQAMTENPNLEISQLLRIVRSNVWQKSNGRQRPGEYDQLISDIYLIEK